jgi:hypothetical protein
MPVKKSEIVLFPAIEIHYDAVYGLDAGARINRILTALERAFQLARSGNYASVSYIKNQLKEGGLLSRTKRFSLLRLAGAFQCERDALAAADTEGHHPALHTISLHGVK